MPTSTENLTLDFMQTDKGEHSSFKLSAILGLKYNHENPISHNFLIQFQNIKTKFVETVEVSPELLRYKFKVGHTYKKGKFVSKQKNEYEEFIKIDTRQMYEQIPFYKALSKNSVKSILGDNDFHSFKYGRNSCYIHKEENRQFIIPSSVVYLYYYFRSSSMKEAVFKRNPYILYDKTKSNIDDKTDAILVLNQKAAKLDGPFIYRFLSDSKANKGFKDILQYISNYKSKNDFNHKATNILPIKALFPTKEQFNIKVRYIELPNENTNITTYLVNEIINDDSTLDFEKLTVLKAKKKDAPIDLAEPGLHIKGRKPRKRKHNVTTDTPAMIYGTNKIREEENAQN